MSSSIPNSVPQFINVVTAALPTGFQIREGTIFGPYVAPQALLITGIHVSSDAPAELGPTYRHEEQYEILCVLCSTAGTDDQASRMVETFLLYEELSEAVANNPTLNNTVRVAWCRQLDYSPAVDGHGLSVGTLTFEVQCQARVPSLD